MNAQRQAAEPMVESIDGAPPERSIGDIIRDTRNLRASQVEKILEYQREHGVRFGEAAVALKMASADDVVFALAQQFQYPYAPEKERERSPELIALNQPFSAQAEAFRALRSQLISRVFQASEASCALAVISAEAHDGKSFFAANLAIVLSQLGGRTLLVDANLRTPRQHELFNLQSKAGLSSILAGRSRSRVIQQVDFLPGLYVLPVGVVPPNPLELVERAAFGMMLRELAGKFDHVVVDTPAACFGADPIVIAARAGAAVVVGRQHTSRLSPVQELVANVSSTSAKMAGVVMNTY
jgi:protein-tyrosine kinase